MEKTNSEFWMKVKLILFGIFSITTLILFYYSLFIVVVSLIGIGLGVLVAPILSFARSRFNIPRAMSALLCLIVFIIVIGGASFGIWYLVSDQAENLSERIPDIVANLKSRFASLFIKHSAVQAQLEGLNVAATAQSIAAFFLKGLQNSFSATSGFLFALIIGLYTSVSLDTYFAAVIRAFPKNVRDKVSTILSQCAITLRLWFRAQMIDMIILGFMTAFGLWFVGVDYWALYGLLTAIFGIIPYIGTLIVLACASLITLTSEPSLVVWVIAVFVIVQQIEGNIILPMLMKGQVELPEVPLLIFILLLGSWLGIVGVFLAPPFFAIIKVLYVEIYLPRVGKSTETVI